MVKNYTDENVSDETVSPSDKSIQFLINYSKSLHLFDSSNLGSKIELFLN